MFSYNTVSEALDGLRRRGYTIDFNFGFSGIKTHQAAISLVGDKFRITEVHRFEGASDPGDEAVVYAIESKDGYRGSLVNGYGISTDASNDEMIKQLSIRFA